MSFGSSKKKKSLRKGLSLTTSARFLTFLQRNGRFTNLFFITLQLQVLLSVAIYNSHVQWKIKSITYAVSALQRNCEARLLIGFVWNQYRQFYFYYTRREQFYLCLKRNADEPKDWCRYPDHSFGHAKWYCWVKKHHFLPWYIFGISLCCGGQVRVWWMG